MDKYLDCWCSSCNRNMSLREILEDEHRGHDIKPEERAALQTVRDYLLEQLPEFGRSAQPNPDSPRSSRTA
jgi:hypothetical protein